MVQVGKASCVDIGNFSALAFSLVFNTASINPSSENKERKKEMAKKKEKKKKIRLNDFVERSKLRRYITLQ